MTETPSIGLRIKRARERKRWTQRQLADALGVNIKTVDNYENDRTRPRNSTGAIEEVLGISLDDTPPPLGPLDDLKPWEEPWEEQVAADEGLAVDIRRWLITDSRAARVAHAARKQRERDRSLRDRGREAG